MAITKSVGQKRKKNLRIFSVLLFLLLTYGLAKLDQGVSSEELSWVNGHQIVNATVTDLREEEEQYRTLKGKRRTRTNYYLAYEFSLQNETFSNSLEINGSQFDAFLDQPAIEILYDSASPDTNLPQRIAEHELGNNNLTSSVFSMAPITGIGCFVLYFLVGLIFIRESKHELPEGFYSENSWLDIDDNYLVLLDGQELVVLDINDKQTLKVQEAYQNNAPMTDLLAMAQPKKLRRIVLAQVHTVITSHNTDTFRLEYGDESISVEFLNAAVKDHALQRITPLLSNRLVSSEKQVTRPEILIRTAIMYAVFAAVFYFFETLWLTVPVGIFALLMIPSTIGSLIDPPLNKTSKLPEGESLAVDDQLNNDTADGIVTSEPAEKA